MTSPNPNPLPLTFRNRICQYRGVIRVPLFLAPYTYHTDFVNFTPFVFKFSPSSFWPFASTNARQYMNPNNAGLASFASITAQNFTPAQAGLMRINPTVPAGTLGFTGLPAWHGNIMGAFMSDNLGLTNYKSARVTFPLGLNINPLVGFSVGNPVTNPPLSTGSVFGPTMITNVSGVPCFAQYDDCTPQNYSINAFDFLGNDQSSGSVWVQTNIQSINMFANIPDFSIATPSNTNWTWSTNGAPQIGPIEIAQGIFWNIQPTGSGSDATVLANMKSISSVIGGITISAAGFVISTQSQGLTGPQNDCYLVDRSGSNFANIQFIPQNALVANWLSGGGSAIFSAAIDPLGILYVVPQNVTQQFQVYNTFSPGNLAFGVTLPTGGFPPIKLPCAPGCFPVKVINPNF